VPHDAQDRAPRLPGAPTSTAVRVLRERVLRRRREAVTRYGMVEPGAKWLLCLSGGMDRYVHAQNIAHIKISQSLVNKR